MDREGGDELRVPLHELRGSKIVEFLGYAVAGVICLNCIICRSCLDEGQNVKIL
jgi:hypothetical protein